MKQYDKQTPRSLEAEQAVIGAMMLDARCIGKVADVLKTDDFYSTRHAVIYETLCGLYDEGKDIDMVALIAALGDKEKNVGGRDAIIEMVEAVPNAASAMFYAAVVKDRARKRALMAVCENTISNIHNCGDQDAEQLIDGAEAMLYAVSDDDAARRGEAVTLSDSLQQTYDMLCQKDGAVQGIDSGLHAMDELTTGFQPGELIVIAARPSMGKTALATTIAVNAAETHRVLVFSIEMSRQQLGERLLSMSSGVTTGRMRRRTLTEEDYGSLTLAHARLAGLKMHIDDSSTLTLAQMRSTARRVGEDGGLKMIVIDYLQLMNHPKAENRLQEVSALSRGLKATARELNVPIIVLAQLNRKAVDRTGNKPRMSDLRESGTIEQDADVVMLLHREDYYHIADKDDDWEPNHIAEVIIEKQRQGPTGVAKLHWNASGTTFTNLQEY